VSAPIRKLDIKLLRQQAEVVGTLAEDITPADPERKREMDALRGVWNLLHTIMDDFDSRGECVLEVKK
jgi:hypothetical protein